MRLTVQGFGAETERYRFLWGMYVRGFKPWLHCKPCFVGTRVEEIFPAMLDGVVELAPKKNFDFVYLHGNAKGGGDSRRKNNLHLAVRPRLGATASVRSSYGPVFTFGDAEAIEVQPPIEELQHLHGYWKCPNFRIGMQMYEVPLAKAGPDRPRDAVRSFRASVFSP